MSASILVVDDAIFMRAMLKDTLAKEGFNVVGEAENGEIAVSQYKSLKPDIVFMDITMPVKTGIEAVKEIIAFDKNAKIIMCSAMGQQTMILEAIQSGAKDFVVKPFQKDRILTAIKKVI